MARAIAIRPGPTRADGRFLLARTSRAASCRDDGSRQVVSVMSTCIRCGSAPSLELEGDFRRAWRAHPNYPDHLLLVGGHDTFRRLSREVVARCRERAEGWSSICELIFRMWHRAMSSHEAYEEHKLYPFLARRYRTSMAELEDDHRALGTRRDAVLAGLRRADELPDDQAAANAVEASLVAYDAALCDHLEREEATVIPLLLDLSREEFQRYTRLPIGRLLDDLPCDQDPGT